MIRNKDLHHEKIVEAAMAEFLEYGFIDASMRRIATAAGMSASGLYKHFASKEEIFAAIVEPTYLGLIGLYRKEATAQEEIINAGDIYNWEDGNDAKLAISYIYDHLDIFRLLICKSQGTKFESFLHDLAAVEEEMTLAFMEELKKKGVKIKEIRLKELHLLTTANINAIFQAVEHDFSREEAMHYADTLDEFFSKAWSSFFGY